MPVLRLLALLLLASASDDAVWSVCGGRDDRRWMASNLLGQQGHVRRSDTTAGRLPATATVLVPTHRPFAMRTDP